MLLNRASGYRPLPSAVSRRARLLSRAVAAISFLLGAGPAAGELTSSERRCIDQVNEQAIAVSRTQHGESRTCVKNAGTGRVVDPESCLVADAKGKVARAAQRVANAFSASCASGAPLVTDPETTSAAHREAAIDLVHDLFGPDLTASGATIAPGAAAARCQDAAFNRARGLWNLKMRTFAQCVAAGTKAGAIVDAAGVETRCLTPTLPDPKGQIARAVRGLTGEVTTKCAGLDPAVLFPGAGLGAGDSSALAERVEALVECRVCRALNRALGLARDCDQFDDGALNASCPGGARPGLHLLSPRDGQTVAGDLLLWAAVSRPPGGTTIRPTLEISTDGIAYRLVDRDDAPDFGETSATTRLDTDALPTGSLHVRARIPGEEVVHRVTVGRRPTIGQCFVSGAPGSLTVGFFCLASDPDGVIVSYAIRFGDGTGQTSTGPTFVHTYGAPGSYDLEFTVCDNDGLCVTEPREGLRIGDPQGPAVRQPIACGCEEMVVFAGGGAGVLGDQRRLNDNGTPGDPTDDRWNPAPLGPDPTFVSLNFEIEALLKPGSDPLLCREGQLIKRTALSGGQVSHKRACSAGRDLTSCAPAGGPPHPECDTRTCRGAGVFDGTACDTGAAAAFCVERGGSCESNNNGVCSEFPFAGGARGNDDYRDAFPLDQGTKRHCPGCRSPRWADRPGLSRSLHADVTGDFTYLADFLAFMEGNTGRCSCHFRLVIDWDGASQTYRPATGVTLIEDAETVNCTLVP